MLINKSDNQKKWILKALMKNKNIKNLYPNESLGKIDFQIEFV